jgi:hypothetical protein
MQIAQSNKNSIQETGQTASSLAIFFFLCFGSYFIQDLFQISFLAQVLTVSSLVTHFMNHHQVLVSGSSPPAT